MRPPGIIPCRFTTLDMLRVESYLLFYPYDNSQRYPFENEGPGDTLWELGLDFTVSPGKTGFRGAEIFFIDDNVPNVQAARARGWHAALWTGNTSLADLMAEAGV